MNVYFICKVMTPIDAVSVQMVPRLRANVIIPANVAARFQTYWADVDATCIVYYPHFFRFVEHAEEELFRAAGQERPLIEECGIWMPRVEAFSKFSKPIRHGVAIRVMLSPEIKGEKTIR